ncbi:NAD-dependent epimerase/dehydratase family protein [Streptomyces sp. OR43]|uniref:NAD-dependent epimerase/dehydratase family protein n=1 Tax=Streptomyces sp. or43 TaxID=2478957 RepID=UPI0011CD5778|nr:NAD-dependent epimerase/dehydratase family protein [Streptomyces sp. or43]TXS38440.1 NAD-dependent epimerase/dehydratase family protein [Streptomyces sp. or43]
MNASQGLRVVVTGATGNVGTSVIRALSRDPAVGSVLGLARRVPDLVVPGVEWATADLSRQDRSAQLQAHLAGADAVVHLAWRFHPTRRPLVTWRSNVEGSMRLFEAVRGAGVPVLVHASSLAAYSPGPQREPGVDEQWATDGWPDAAYSREKAYLERVLDTFELRHPHIRVVRMRPTFLSKETSASEQRRIFAGRHLPGALIRPDLLPFLPYPQGLRFQMLHTDDAAEAFRLAVLTDVRGAFNLAADPVVDAHLLGELLDTRVVPVPAAVARGALATAWWTRTSPAPPNLFDAVLRIPLMSCARAHEELRWRPARSASDALSTVLRGAVHGEGEDTAPMAGKQWG